jgi:glutaminyl-tRNA synthetase
MRVMGVLRPLRLVIENYPEGQVEELFAVNNPEDASMGSRTIPFSRVLYIEQEDFREDPPKKFFRLSPGQEVRLRYAYIIKCTSVTKDETTGEIQEVRCTYDPETRSGGSQTSRKVKGTLHWVSAAHAIEAEVRLYDHLFLVPDPGSDKDGKDYRTCLNPESLKRLLQCYLEPSLRQAKVGTHFQFERQGYFCVDCKDSSEGKLVFNRTVALRDSWRKIEQAN